jgi:hypothetical protein
MNKRILRLSLRGGLVAGLVVAVSVRGTTGVLFGLGAGLALTGIVIMEVIRSGSAFRRMRKRLQDARPWRIPVAVGEVEAWDPYAEDRVTGLWNGCRVGIALTATGARVVVSLDRWPAGLAAERRSQPGGAITGDDTFDRAVRVIGDDALWRCTLTAEPRGHLVALCGHTPATVYDRTLEVLLADADIENLEAVVDLAAALAATLPELAADPMARVFELAAAEPISGVRAGHYRWLVESGWNMLQVHRAAAADPDPAISRWGASQLAPAGGVFR